MELPYRNMSLLFYGLALPDVAGGMPFVQCEMPVTGMSHTK